jgi:hypothetical protein
MNGMNACTPTQERPMHDSGRDIERGPAGIAGLLPRELTAAPRDATPKLRIRLCSGSGEGPTPLAAFDAALMDAGVADHNLLCLSSVIPPNAIVELHHRDRGRLEHDLHATLESMRSYRVTRYGPVQTVIESRLCTGRPVCALVAAVYVCEPW